MINSKRQERIQKIMRVIEDQGNASTIFLAKSLNVSESSIRRDIGYLVSSGKYNHLFDGYGDGTSW